MQLETTDLDCGLDKLLRLSTLRAGDRVVVYPRWTVDERLPAEERVPFTPTRKQILYAPRGCGVDSAMTSRSRSGAISQWARQDTL